MYPQELSKKCWLIFHTVGRWLAGQDELTQAFHAVAVESNQIASGVHLDTFLTIFEVTQRLLFKRCDKRRLESEANIFLNSEFVELSHLFRAFYEEFNRRYFEGGLPCYRVKIMHALLLSDTEERPVFLDANRQQIVLDYDRWPEAMLSFLIRQMAIVHVRTQRGDALKDEVRRLQKVGAPTQDDVQRLTEAGWTMFSSAPWYIA